MIEHERLLRRLESQTWYQGQIGHVEVLSENSPDYRQPSATLTDEMEDFLGSRGYRLYSHQAETVDLIKKGRNVLISTPTASGKTLAFNVPIIDDLLMHQEARALYLYPTKALANDQLEVLTEMDEEFESSIRPAVYDGDTPRSSRPKIRENSRVIISNPYGIHRYLPWHEKWEKFYSELRYVVLDEAHQYRGVFGSNVAFLIRRLKRVCASYGSNPQFVLSSATIANPRELAEKLVQEDFSIVDNNGAPSGKKYFVFWNAEEDPEHSPHRQTSRLMDFLIRQGLQSLCFTTSRRLAELVARWTKKSVGAEVMAYRAGYRPEERRKIEADLREGRIPGVVSTNALEVGIDVGGLDAVVMSGYPGTVVSTWQQAGRAGRGEEDSLAVLVGFENPLDQYFMNYPDRFFGKSPENAVIDLHNPHLTLGFLLCAASELPLKDGEKAVETYGDELETLESGGLLNATPLGYVYSGTSRPSEIVALNNIGQNKIEVVDKGGELIETMDLTQAFREAHPGAVLLHQDGTYVVEGLDLEANLARVGRQDVDYYTDALSTTDVHLRETVSRKYAADYSFHRGEVEVSEEYFAYKVKQYGDTVATNPLDLPTLNFETESMGITFPSEALEMVESEGCDPAGGLHGLEHALIAVVPLHAMCDRWDVGGVSTKLHPDTGGPTVFVYDAYEGGIGIARKCYNMIGTLISTTYELISDCDCEEGCPSCIYSPKCGNNNEPLDKQAAVLLLEDLLQRRGAL